VSSKLIIFGGSGMLGKALEPYLVGYNEIYMPRSSEVDLLDEKAIYDYLTHIKPDKVLNISGKVAGLFTNLQHPYEYFIANQKMTMNVLTACLKSNVDYLLSCSSTCAYPDVANSYPMMEEQIFDGTPSIGNLGYGIAKRNIVLSTILANQEYNKNYGVIIPSNLYGTHYRHFGLSSSHYVTNLIYNLLNNSDFVQVGGSGKPMRQFTYVADVAKAISLMVDNNDNSVLNCATPENLTILELAEKTIKANNLKHAIVLNPDFPDGQFRKDVCSSKLIAKYNFEFTSFDEGVKKTFDFYKDFSC